MTNTFRILVYGVTGSGKSTLAAEISRATGIPYHSVDDLTWNAGWVQVPVDEQRRLIGAICRTDSWVLDSGYSAWLDIPLARVQLVVGLDYPRRRSLCRLLLRTVDRLLYRRTVCNGNRETVRRVFGPDSILIWHFRSFGHKRSRIRRWESDPAGPAVRRLTSPDQVEPLLEEFATAQRGPSTATQ